MLEAIAELTARAGYPPTVKEIAVRVGLRQSSDVDQQIEALLRKGLISRVANRARTTVITRAGLAELASGQPSSDAQNRELEELDGRVPPAVGTARDA